MLDGDDEIAISEESPKRAIGVENAAATRAQHAARLQDAQVRFVGWLGKDSCTQPRCEPREVTRDATTMSS